MTMSPEFSGENQSAGLAATPSANFCLAIHVLAIFASAFLLFSVQPMFTKMVLPQLGGSPAVWSVAMVFFQGLLLVGYLYAHLLDTYASGRQALIIHLCLLATAFLACPIALATNLGQPPESGQAIWLIGVFFVSVGLPFFAVSANGPLLQAWFSKSGHPQASEPYFLYGASNLGSFSALLLYPLLIEPWLSLKEQSLFWSFGYAAFIGLVALCGIFVWRAGWRTGAYGHALPLPPISGARKLAWIGLAFVPSGLLVAVTAHISTDIATAPFLWVVPLAIFLLTFVVVFRESPLIPHRWVVTSFPVVVFGTILIYFFLRTNLAMMLASNLLLLFVVALLCHGELYKRRTGAEQLTSFYLFISLGGVLGGIFTGLIAPYVFSSVAEYPILIVAAALCLPFRQGHPTIAMVTKQAVGVAIVLLAITAMIFGLNQLSSFAHRATVTAAIFVSCGAVLWLDRRRPVIVAGAIALMFISANAWSANGSSFTVRSFFGVTKISLSKDGEFRQLAHGNTVHGGIRVATADGVPVDGPPRPSTYYSFGSSMAEGIVAARAVAGGHLARVAVAGLGTGSLACHQKPGENWSYFEIDPQIVALASDPKLFWFLKDCAPTARMVVGDARLTLAREPSGFDLILLDAFSSDSIPIHLVTTEAFTLYLAKLSANGLLIFHISNRYLTLSPFIAAIAKELGLEIMLKNQSPDDLSLAQKRDGAGGSVVVALARKTVDFGPLPQQAGWVTLSAEPGLRPWTDDYSNIVAAIMRR